MPTLDQNITYRVNVDDSNFQAKLTQMRASLDATMGGTGGMGGMAPGFAFNAMSAMQPSNFGQLNLGGSFASFGGQVMPVTYTPPAIAMQPHFGMFQVNQTLSQAGLAAIGGPMGMMMGDVMSRGFLPKTEMLSPRISYAEYMAASSQNFGNRMGDAFMAGGLATANLTANLGVGAIGSAAGASLFRSGIGRAFGGIMGGMIAGSAASAYFDAVADRAAENIGYQSTLAAGSFRFATGLDSDPLTGRGFNIANRRRAADFIQQLESRDVRLNSTDYQQVLEGGMQMDLFSGTRDVNDFKKKFKDLVDNVKTVSSTLHTSLREGLEVIRGMRDIGVEGAGVGRLTVQSEALGRASGRTGMEMMAIGQAGAEMFRGTGIAMERGFTLAQQNTSMIRSMLNSGAISRETVAQAGGENALAQQMTAGALGSFQTLMGRGAMMAAFNPATGTLDPNMVGRMMGGDALSILSNAANLGPGGIMKFQAHQEELISKMSPMQMQMFGAAQRMASARMLQQVAPDLSLRDAFIAESKRQGVGIEQINTELGMLTTDPSKFAEDQRMGLSTMTRQAAMEDFRNRFGGAAIGKAFTRTFVDPVSRMALDIRQGVQQTVSDITERTMDFVTGAATVDRRSLDSSTIGYAKELAESTAEQKIESARKAGTLRPGMEEDIRRSELLKQAGGVLVDAGGSKWWGQDSTGLAKAFERNMVTSGGRTTATVAGVTAKVVDTKDEAEALAKIKGVPSMALHVGDRFAVVALDDIDKIAKFGNKFKVSEESVQALAGKAYDRKAIATITEGLRGKLKGLSVEEKMAFIGSQIGGKDFDAKKFLAGETTEEELANIENVAKNVSPDLYRSIRERGDLSTSVADAGAVVRSKLSEEGVTAGRAARNALSGMLAGSKNMGAISALIEGQQGGRFGQAFSRFVRGEKGAQADLEYLLRSSDVSEDVTDKLLKMQKSPEAQKIAAGFEKEAKLAGAVSAVGAKATGLTQAGDYTLAGTVEVSQKTLQAVADFARTTEDQIRLLQTLVTQLKGQLTAK